VEPVLLPPRSPNLNAHCERFVRSIKEEALAQMVMLENALCIMRSSSTWPIIMPSEIIKGSTTTIIERPLDAMQYFNHTRSTGRAQRRQC
jgi:hypothetical protein